MIIKFVISLLLIISLVNGSRICHKCTGIQCSRTSHNETKTCYDSLDICVTIFENFNVVESGCSEEISPNLMKKCMQKDIDKYEYDDSEDDESIENTDCLKCNENLCNNKGRKEFQCIQCDSNVNPDCKENPSNIKATPCPVSTSPNSYCFIENIANKATIRGCSGNLKHQRDCLSNSYCMLCLAGDMENCNVAQFKSDNGGSNNTTVIPPSNNTTANPNVTDSPHNTTAIPPSNNTTANPNVTDSPHNTTVIPPSNNTTSNPNVTDSPHNTTAIPPSNNTTANPLSPTTVGPSSATAINCGLTILILSQILNFIYEEYFVN